jgi:hypothetical protein
MLLFVVSGIFGILENFAIIGLLLVGLIILIANIVMILMKQESEK